jgi:hypothetical protein
MKHIRVLSASGLMKYSRSPLHFVEPMGECTESHIVYDNLSESG